MPLRAFVLSLVPAVVSAASAYGHPGHAVEVAEAHSISHYALHPDHLAMWIALFAALAVGWLLVRANSRRPAAAYARVRKSH